MNTPIVHASSATSLSIPLLDASNLPSADDWAVLEAIGADADFGSDMEPDFDRFGQFRVSASFHD